MSSVNSGTAAPAASSAAPASSPAASSAPAASSPATSAAAASSQAPAASSAAAPAASSAAPAPAASAPATSAAAPAAPTTLVVTAPSAAPSITEVATSFITITPSASVAGQAPSVVVITSLITTANPNRSTATASNSRSAAAATSTSASDTPQSAQNENTNKGLSTGGKTAIAVVIPLVVVGLLVLAGIILWRKRKQRKGNEEERRKEVEEYGYNPNHDPTLPAVGAAPQMVEDDSGYRGWGNTATSSGRKASTTLTGGMAYSDSTSNPDAYNPSSPTHGAYSDAPSGDPLMNGRRETMDSDGLAALGAVGAAAPNSTQNQAGVKRGISNASSTYSAADHSDNSGDYPGMTTTHHNEYYADQGYYQANPYGNDPYGAGGQPVIRDVSARRNTQIQNPSVFPQQGNSGISQNF